MNARQNHRLAIGISPEVASFARQCGPRCRFITGLVLVAVFMGLFATAVSAQVSNAPAGKPDMVLSEKASTPDFTSGADVLDAKYRLAIGDQLSFRIIEDEDDPKELMVTDSGDLQVPYLGRYPAVGKTCKELALALKGELEKTYYRQATVIIAVDAKPRSRGKIYLVGAIRAAGPQDISSDEELTVSRAILRAGSFTEFADQKNVQITRGTGTGSAGKKTFTVNVARVFEKGKTEDDLPLLPGDLIFVPERMIRF